MEVFTQNHTVPFTKMLTFYRKEPFTLKASYYGHVPYPDPYIGQYTVRDVKPTPEGESQKVWYSIFVFFSSLYLIENLNVHL